MREGWIRIPKTKQCHERTNVWGSGALTVMLSPYDERERIAEVRVAGRRPGLLMAEMIFLAC